MANADPVRSAFDVFISYAQPNKLDADAVCAKLEECGIRCWIAPRNILPGSEWAASIVDGIDRSRVLVLIFSSGANASPQVRREVDRAIAKGLSILPLRIEDVVPTKALEYCLGNTHWLDAFDPPLARHIEQLIRSVRALLNREALAEPAAVASRRPVRWHRQRQWQLALGIGVVVLAATGFALLQRGETTAAPPTDPPKAVEAPVVAPPVDRLQSEVAARVEAATHAIETQWSAPSRDLAAVAAACDRVLTELDPSNDVAKGYLQRILVEPAATEAQLDAARNALSWFGAELGDATSFRRAVDRVRERRAAFDFYGALRELDAAKRIRGDHPELKAAEENVGQLRTLRVVCAGEVSALEAATTIDALHDAIAHAEGVFEESPEAAGAFGLSAALDRARASRTALEADLERRIVKLDAESQSIASDEQARSLTDLATALEAETDDPRVAQAKGRIAEFTARATAAIEAPAKPPAPEPAEDPEVVKKREKQAAAFHAAEQLHIHGDFEKAVTAFDKYLKDHPGAADFAAAAAAKADCLVSLGDAALQQRKTSSGESYFVKSIAAYRQSIDAREDFRDGAGISAKARAAYRSAVINLRLEQAYRELQRKSPSSRSTYLRYFDAVNNDLKMLRGAYAVERDTDGVSFIEKAEAEVAASRKAK